MKWPKGLVFTIRVKDKRDPELKKEKTFQFSETSMALKRCKTAQIPKISHYLSLQKNWVPFFSLAILKKRDFTEKQH